MNYNEPPEVFDKDIEFECRNCAKQVEGVAYFTSGDQTAEAECAECSHITTVSLYSDQCACGDKCVC